MDIEKNINPLRDSMGDKSAMRFGFYLSFLNVILLILISLYFHLTKTKPLTMEVVMLVGTWLFFPTGGFVIQNFAELKINNKQDILNVIKKKTPGFFTDEYGTISPDRIIFIIEIIIASIISYITVFFNNVSYEISSLTGILLSAAFGQKGAQKFAEVKEILTRIKM